MPTSRWVAASASSCSTPTVRPNRSTSSSIDIGAQIRAFLTSNVALSAFGGLAVLAGDADGFALDGQPVGALGLTYFFW